MPDPVYTPKPIRFVGLNDPTTEEIFKQISQNIAYGGDRLAKSRAEQKAARDYQAAQGQVFGDLSAKGVSNTGVASSARKSLDVGGVSAVGAVRDQAARAAALDRMNAFNRYSSMTVPGATTQAADTNAREIARQQWAEDARARQTALYASILGTAGQIAGSHMQPKTAANGYSQITTPTASYWGR